MALNFMTGVPIAHWDGSGGRKPVTVAAAGLWRQGKQPLPAKTSMMSGSGSGSSVGGKYKGTHMREKQLTEMIEKKVLEAKEVCGDDLTTDECKVAWDEVEEVSQAKADLRLKLQILHQDPLESFCQDNPETDECRLYED